jgi:hypothetical protein
MVVAVVVMVVVVVAAAAAAIFPLGEEYISYVHYFARYNLRYNLIHEEIKRRLNSGNDCNHSVQNLLSSRLLSKNLKIRIYKTIILPVVLYGCET